MTLIKRDDAVKTVIRKCSPICAWQVGTQQYPDCVVAEINELPSDAVDCTDFIEWLVDRVLDETIWEYNSVAYGEIICRKLEKLGVLETTEEPSYYIRPSAEAVQGEWVGLAECSVCGKQADDFIDGYVDGIEYLPNYCPNCGARMKGGDTE